VFHIITHGFVKASAFVNSRWYIHIDGRQDLRNWRIGIPIFIIVMAFVILCRVGGSLVGASKEYIILSFMRVVVVVIGWGYSKNFMNNMDGVNHKYILDGGFILLMFLMGGLTFISLEVVIMRIVMLCIRIFNIGNIYVMNK
jgi:NADH:ubiquinone oxidoreductase subunit 5 (subunit L)/multisubunit Na+/H+ antiporter MnhA subunit